MGTGRKSNSDKSSATTYMQNKQANSQDLVSDSSKPGYRMSYADFTKLDAVSAGKLLDDARADFSTSQLRGMGLNTNDFQRTIIALGLHGKPTVLEDDVFDKAFQTDSATPMLYRGLYFNADAVDNTKYADTYFTGTGLHGDGIYLTTNKNYAEDYGYGSVDGRDTGFTAFIDKNRMKSIKEDDLIHEFQKEPAHVQESFGNDIDCDSAIASYAIYKGYNTIHAPGGNSGPRNRYKNMGSYITGEDFYVALTRDVLVIRKNRLI